MNFTETQKNRLGELGADEAACEESFEDAKARDAAFRELERRLVARERGKIATLLHEKHVSLAAGIIGSLEGWLQGDAGFTKVSTPTIIPLDMLDKMTITEDDPLREQVFYVGKNRCLRPMLAPNLYTVMRELRRITRECVRIYEVGSCFRKESQGAQHMNEFTMLNLVEIGTEEGTQMARLEALAEGAMAAAGITGYTLIKESSTVYGETVDIECGGVEIASGAYGPHVLDSAWGVFDPWVGIGIGIERAALVKGGYRTIKRVGRSTGYADGVTLNL
ncbi:MAG: pyrrolysine--tRNA(Pyl) ligase large subunit [Clostridiales Family XIII bacterium]|jgi:phenylalanyl-tRNA synthetase alpha chain|nr:pyrrolysine--tRNA(Pyl) ligase large subunit [Clostridiales Family XIII bacterium]